jgi:hypothetical protein
MQAAAALATGASIRGMFASPSVAWTDAPGDPGAMILRSVRMPVLQAASLTHLPRMTASAAPDRGRVPERGSRKRRRRRARSSPGDMASLQIHRTSTGRNST